MIIDTHVHHGCMGPFYMPDEMVSEMISKYNIDHIILSNCLSCERDEELNLLPKNFSSTQCDSLRQSLNFARSHPGRVSVMPWIKPVTEGLTEYLIKLIEDNLDLVKGIKFHAHNSKLRSDAKELEPYYELAAKYNFPVAIHTGGVNEAHVKYVLNAAKNHPDVNFILVHMGLGTDNTEAIRCMDEVPNIYGDTTWVSIESTLEAIKRCGDDRIVFGTDSPIDGLDTYAFNKAGERSLYQQYFNEFKDMVSKETYEKIMYKNAIKLFNLTNFM